MCGSGAENAVKRHGNGTARRWRVALARYVVEPVTGSNRQASQCAAVWGTVRARGSGGPAKVAAAGAAVEGSRNQMPLRENCGEV